MSRNKHYEQMRTINRLSSIAGFAIIATGGMIALFSYALFEDSFDADTGNFVSSLIFISTFILGYMIVLLPQKSIIYCEHCGEFIDYEKEYYIKSHKNKRIGKKQTYHIGCFRYGINDR